MLKAKRHDWATENSSSSASPDGSTSAARVWAHSSSKRFARVVLVVVRRRVVTTPPWRNDGGYEAGSRATWNAWSVCLCVDGVCPGCAAEPQWSHKGSDEPAGRRARANWRARSEAWAVRKRGGSSRNSTGPWSAGAGTSGASALDCQACGRG